jgi:hypothetical protein
MNPGSAAAGPMVATASLTRTRPPSVTTKMAPSSRHGHTVAPSHGSRSEQRDTARADGPELADQHEPMSRDVKCLVRLTFHCGDVEGDDAY